MSRLMILGVAAAVLAGCSAQYDQAVAQREAMKFDAQLAGLVPGRPQSCLSNLRTNNIVAEREGVLLFRDGSTVYATDTGGGCHGVLDNNYTLVTENFGGSLCNGTLARVVDLTAGGGIRGTCVLGDFTPYRRPKARP
jgi:hypothetical protein